MTDATDAGLQEHLLSAADARLRRVVAVVDALPARGDADALIAPLRPRLARLRPPRPLTLTRLLFAPVEPLIVPSASWQIGSPGIPRSALAALGGDLCAALGEAADPLRARCAGRSMEDEAVVAECGAPLWAEAAKLLPGRLPPADWTSATGLPPAAHRALVVPLGVLLGEGVPLHKLPTLAGQTALAEAERLLRQAGARGGAALTMMLALLLRRLPRAQRLLQLADGIGEAGGAGQASDRVMAFLLGDLRGAVASDAALPEAADQVRRSARLLEELEAAAGAAERPSRMQMVRAARQDLSAMCRDRMAAAAESLAVAAEMAAEAADLAAMEDTARALRLLDAVGRRLGEAEVYDRVLSGTAGRLTAGTLLAPNARLRLAEILLGPDAALALVEGGP